LFRGQTLVSAPRIHYRGFASRLIVHPVESGYFGFDWYRGTALAGGVEKRRSDIEGGYERGRAVMRFEQIFASDGPLRRRGGYVMGAWRLSPRWEAVSRADWYTPKVGQARSSSVAYIAGGNAFLLKHIKVGFNVGAQHDQGPLGWSRVLIAQVMPYF
jgi:hypothetical protein